MYTITLEGNNLDIRQIDVRDAAECQEDVFTSLRDVRKFISEFWEIDQDTSITVTLPLYLLVAY